MDSFDYLCENPTKKIKINNSYDEDVLFPFVEMMEHEEKKETKNEEKNEYDIDEFSGDETILDSSTDYETQQTKNEDTIVLNSSRYGYKKINHTKSSKEIAVRGKIYEAFEIMMKTVSSQN